MLRLTEIKLPLDHPPEAIAKAAVAKLGIAAKDLLSCTVFKRGNDARKKNAILLVYTLDVEVKNEAALLQRFAKDNSSPQSHSCTLAGIHHVQRKYHRPRCIHSLRRHVG